MRKRYEVGIMLAGILSLIFGQKVWAGTYVYQEGKWRFQTEEETVETGWIQEGGNWYCLDSQGQRISGWHFEICLLYTSISQVRFPLLEIFLI